MKQPEYQSSGSASSRAGVTTFYTLLCFSLAGLIMGFAIGGFAGHLSATPAGGTGSTTTSEPTLIGHGPVPSKSASPENILLGVPSIGAGDYTSPEMADGTTSYQLSAQIINKGDKTPITANDVVCRLWLTDDLDATMAGLSAGNFAIPRNPTTFSQPFPGEIAGVLNFASSSSQTQPCVTSGKTRWAYTLSSDVPEGTYYLAVLADWKGIHYNWYMVAIQVHNADS
jgi:hypothetical protein